GQPHKHRPPSGLGPQHRQASMRVLRSEIWSIIPHIYHRAPSTARVDDGSAPITTSLGRSPKRAAPKVLTDEISKIQLSADVLSAFKDANQPTQPVSEAGQ